MGDMIRRTIEARRPDGSALGGPGITPFGPEPARIRVDCPACGVPRELDAQAMTRKLWNGLARGEGEDILDSGCKLAFDAITPLGWDVRCSSCPASFRIVYTLEEWGKMSTSYFPALIEALVIPSHRPAGQI
jgi:hypothetical protein